MKTFNAVKIVMLCLWVAVLSGCKDNVYYTMENSDEKLCGKVWAEEYTTSEGRYRHQFEFTKIRKNDREQRSGKETTVLYKSGSKETTEKDFTWEWTDDTREGLTLNYGAGDVKYFDNVWVRERYLSGEWEGSTLVLTEENYLSDRS